VKVDISRPRKPRGTWDTCSKSNNCKTWIIQAFSSTYAGSRESSESQIALNNTSDKRYGLIEIFQACF
jgi:hypothetical protein